MSKKPRVLFILPPRMIKGGENLLTIPSIGMAQVAELYNRLGFEVSSEDIDIRLCNNSTNYLNFIKTISSISDKDIEKYLLNGVSTSDINKLIKILFENIDVSNFDLFGISIGDRSCAYPGLIMGKHLKSLNKKAIGGGGCLRQEDRKFEAFDKYFLGRFTDEENMKYIEEEFSIDTSGLNIKKYPRLRPNFDGYPFESFHNLSPIVPEKFMFFNPDNIHFLPYQWSWNCPHSCSFCTGSISDDKKVYARDVDESLADIKHLSKTYDSRFFFMMNEYSTMLPKHSRELYTKMKDIDIVWCGACRCDMDIEMSELMANAGCRFMCFGFESGSKKVLRDMNKEFDLEKFRKILKKNTENNVWNALYILIGFPTEREEHFKDTFNFISDNIDDIDIIYPCPFYLSPSDITENPDKYDIVISNSKFDLRHMSEQDMTFSLKDGTSFEELQDMNDIRMFQINKLFFIQKQIKEFYLRGALFYILSSMDKCKNKNEVYERLDDHYQKHFNSKFTELKITENDRLNKDRWNIDIKSISTESFKKKTILKGTEATVHPNFLNIIKGFASHDTEVLVETDGLTFSLEKNCRKMYDSGLRKINLKLFGHDKESYEKATKIPGSFDMMLKGVINWKKLGGNIETICCCDLETCNLYELTKLMYKIESPNRFY